MATKFITEQLEITSDSEVQGELNGSKDIIHFNRDADTGSAYCEAGEVTTVGDSHSGVPTVGIPMVRPGSVTGMSVRWAGSTGGTSGFCQLHTPDGFLFGVTLTSSVDITTQPRYTDEFSAGDIFAAFITVNGVDTMRDIVVEIEVIYDE